jgi:hypothetical protein
MSSAPSACLATAKCRPASSLLEIYLHRQRSSAVFICFGTACHGMTSPLSRLGRWRFLPGFSVIFNLTAAHATCVPRGLCWGGTVLCTPQHLPRANASLQVLAFFVLSIPVNRTLVAAPPDTANLWRHHCILVVPFRRLGGLGLGVGISNEPLGQF